MQRSGVIVVARLIIQRRPRKSQSPKRNSRHSNERGVIEKGPRCPLSSPPTQLPRPLRHMQDPPAPCRRGCRRRRQATLRVTMIPQRGNALSDRRWRSHGMTTLPRTLPSPEPLVGPLRSADQTKRRSWLTAWITQTGQHPRCPTPKLPFVRKGHRRCSWLQGRLPPNDLFCQSPRLQGQESIWKITRIWPRTRIKQGCKGS